MMELKTKCRNCKCEYEYRINTNQLRDYSYCSEECNEEYFNNFHEGILPAKCRDDFFNTYRSRGLIHNL